MPSDGENLAHNVPCTASRHHYELIIKHLSKLGICLNKSVQQYAQPDALPCKPPTLQSHS